MKENENKFYYVIRTDDLRNFNSAQAAARHVIN